MASGASIDELLLNLLQGTVGNYVLHSDDKQNLGGPKDREPYLVLRSIDLEVQQKSGAVLSDKEED